MAKPWSDDTLTVSHPTPKQHQSQKRSISSPAELTTTSTMHRRTPSSPGDALNMYSDPQYRFGYGQQDQQAAWPWPPAPPSAISGDFSMHGGPNGFAFYPDSSIQSPPYASMYSGAKPRKRSKLMYEKSNDMRSPPSISSYTSRRDGSYRKHSRTRSGSDLGSEKLAAIPGAIQRFYSEPSYVLDSPVFPSKGLIEYEDDAIHHYVPPIPPTPPLIKTVKRKPCPTRRKAKSSGISILDLFGEDDTLVEVRVTIGTLKVAMWTIFGLMMCWIAVDCMTKMYMFIMSPIHFVFRMFGLGVG